jgi:phosphoglucosamine mutase
MEERLFGTDGIRGIPGRYPFVPSFIRSLGAVAARLLPMDASFHANGGPPKILIGRDTRSSGVSILRDLAVGLGDGGMRIIDCGVLPTPAISYLVPRLKAAGGIVISASHNPAEFNGVKFFDSRGLKINLDLECKIENELAKKSKRSFASKPKFEAGQKYLYDYLDFLRSVFPATLDLSQMTLAIDAANGASSRIARDFFESLGARVYCLGMSPNGQNINLRCGALDTGALRDLVLAKKADAGIAFDGDADRAVFCDEKGEIKDGDFILGVAALRMRKLGILKGDCVVLTTMSNISIEKFLNERGISTLTVGVGDRHVTEALERKNLSLGGEPSGHIVFRPFLRTGDGMLTAVQTLAALTESGRPLSELLLGFRPFPQVIENVQVLSKVALERLPRFQREVRRQEIFLKDQGRLFVRYSGTEPLLRIMVEGPQLQLVRKIAQSLAAAYKKEAKEIVHDRA